MREIDLFIQYLQKHNFKVTPQRELIANYIFATHKHFSAEELYDKLKQKDKTISRATVYRTLDTLKKSTLIDEVGFDRSQKFYEHIIGHEHHDHLVCIKCFKIIEFSNPQIEKTQIQITKKEKFYPRYHALKIYGECKNCRKKSDKQKSKQKKE